MSKDIPDTVTASPENTSFVQADSDAFASFMAMPVSKLDADQYLVSDLDGVTEGLFGSGNMNFLMMQAGQTNDYINARNNFDMTGESDGISSSLPNFLNGGIPTGQAGNLAGGGGDSLGALANDFDAFGRFENGNRTSPGAISESNTSSNTQSSSFFNNSQNFASATENNSSTDITRILPPGDPVDGTSGIDGISGNDGSSGNNGTNGSSGNNGTNGTNGVDGNDGGPFSLGPVGIDLHLALDNITNLAVDIISGDQIINVIDEIIDLSPILAPLDGLLGNIAAGVDLGVILNPFQYDNSPNDQDLHLDTGLSALGLPLLSSLDNLNVNLDPVEGLLGDLDINLDLGAEVLTDLLGGNTQDQDLGLDLGGLGLGDLLPVLGSENILLNPVEDLLGDIDLGITPAIDLFNTANIDNGAGDTDIVIPLDINLLGSNLLGDTLSIPLDPIEAITGDIDLDITAAANLLGNAADGLIDNFTGGTGNDTILSQLGNGLTDLTSPLLPQSNGGDTDIALGLDGGLADNVGSIFLNPVEDTVGDIDLGLDPSLNLFDTSNISNAGGDTDIVVPLDIELLNSHLLNDTLNINLDPLEAITGDIDLDVTAAANLLGHTADPLIDSLSGGSTSPNFLSDVGDAVSGLAGAILPPSDGDTDLVIGGTADLLDTNLLHDGGALSLDMVEHFVGDIDIGVMPGLDLLGTSTGGADTTDISIPLDVSILGSNLLNQPLDLNLDGLEALTGDIDLTVPLGTDLLADPGSLVTDTWEILEVLPNATEGFSSNLAESVFSTIDTTLNTALDLLSGSTPNLGDLNTDILGGGANGLGDIGMWTDSILPDAGNMLGSGLGMDISSILPDPIAGATIVPITTPTIIADTLHGIGLGGGRHFGGLFG